MRHLMNLQPRYFDFIKNGTKRIELRLYDEKRRKIQLGDTIEFGKSVDDESGEKLKAEVVGILRYGSFADLVEDFDVSVLADFSMSKQELLDELGRFYTLAEQDKYGVIGLRLETAEDVECGRQNGG